MRYQFLGATLVLAVLFACGAGLALAAGQIQWSGKGLPSESRTNIAAASNAGKVFFAGGKKSQCCGGLTFSSSVDVYDTSTETWSYLHLSRERSRIGAAAVGNKVLFVGGDSWGQDGGLQFPSQVTINRADIYDTDTGEWYSEDLPVDWAVGLSAATVGERAYFAGSGQQTDGVLVYDSLTDAWSTDHMSLARTSVGMASACGRLYIGGGTAGRFHSAVVDIYDPQLDSWSVSSLSVPRSSVAATSVDDLVFFAGGSSSSGRSDVVDIYDCEADTWRTASLSVGRTGIQATSAGGLAFFSAGYQSSFVRPFQSEVVDIYDPSDDSWSTRVIGSRSGHAATSSGDTAFFGGGYGFINRFTQGYRGDVVFAHVIVDNPPTVGLNGPFYVAEGDVVTITASGFDPEGEPLAYSWDLDGDGQADTTGQTASFSAATLDGPSTASITVQVADPGGQVAEATALVLIENVAPEGIIETPVGVQEGDEFSLSLSSVTDPSSADTNEGFTYAFDCGDGAGLSAFSSVSTVSCATDDDGVRSVAGHIMDKDGGVGVYTDSVVVANVPPVATFNSDGAVDEGTSYELALNTPADVSSADTNEGFTYAFDCGDGAGLSAFSSVSAASCATEDDGVRSVAGHIMDKDGGVSVYTDSVVVANVPPVASFNSDGAVDEGTSFELALNAPADPSSADTNEGFTYAFDCGDGAGLSSFSSVSAVSCATEDDGVRSVAGHIMDKDGGVSVYTDSVVVDNVPPVASFVSDGAVDEGTSYELALNSPADASSADTNEGFTYAFDCGDGAGLSSFSSVSAVSCATEDDGVRSVAGHIMDKDGGVSVYTDSVVVDNVPPVASFYSDGAADEGTSFELALNAPADASSADTNEGFTYAFDCGDGAGLSAFSSISAVSCATEDDGVRAVAGHIMDKDGGVSVYTDSVVVNNVSPSFVSFTVPTDPIDISVQPISGVSASFIDPGTADTHTCSVDFGDGNGPQVGTVLAGECVGPAYSYSSAGVYEISIEIADDDGGSEISAATTLVVIYDPTGGSVSGAGWIDSPPGAFEEDPSLTGKAILGFVSKYKTGASVPTGHTEFRFQLAGLRFKSTNYDWLVIAGSKAMYKGEGVVNGVGGYKFQLNAIDGAVTGGGGVDKFRIKIRESEGGVVYDNQAGAGDNDDPTTVLGGGNIKVHKK